MSRLTSELSSHKTLLDELRSLREADKNTLRQKVREVDFLRQEVEKIAGEVEVLKGVVEEGLRERRGRTYSQGHGEPQGHDMAMRPGEDSGDDEVERGQDGDESLYAQRDAEDYELEDVQPALARRALLERTARADHAAYDSVPIEGHGINTQRYVEDSELERISVELEERRSERSRSSSRLGSSVSSNGSHRTKRGVISGLGAQPSNTRTSLRTYCHAGQSSPTKATSVPFIGAHDHAGSSSPCTNARACPRATPRRRGSFPTNSWRAAGTHVFLCART